MSTSWKPTMPGVVAWGTAAGGRSVLATWGERDVAVRDLCPEGWSLFGVLTVLDPDLAVHSARSALIAAGLADEAELEVDAATFWAFLLHDIGTLHVPSALLRQPGPLTASEHEVMATHAMRTAQLLGQVPELVAAAGIAKHHHERWDGTGYPSGLSGPDIPRAARILAVGDAFAAMTAHRPHRGAHTIERAAEALEAGAGTQFDPALTRVFAGLIPRLPSDLATPFPVARLPQAATERLAAYAERGRDLSRAQLEALFAAAIGLDAAQAARRLGRAPGTQRNWAASLRRALGCPPRLTLRRFLAGVGLDVFEAVAGPGGSASIVAGPPVDLLTAAPQA